MTTNLQEIQNKYNICKAGSVKMAEEKLPIYKKAILKITSECSAIPAKPIVYNIVCWDKIFVPNEDYKGGERYIAAEKVSKEESKKILADLKNQGKCDWDYQELYLTGNESGTEHYESLIKAASTSESVDKFVNDVHYTGISGFSYGSNDAVFGSCDTAISQLFEQITNMYYAKGCENAFKEEIANYVSGLTNQVVDEA